MAMFKALAVSQVLFLSLITTGYQILADTYNNINPANELAISPSINNVGLTADYTFSFIPESRIDSGGVVEIIFPSQFSSGLGVTTPDCSPHTCTISVLTVTVSLTTPLYNESVNTITVKNIVNPSNIGGTGNFKLFTKVDGYVIDRNTIFGRIGIAKAAATLASTEVDVKVGGSYRAGVQTEYDFKFRLQTALVAGSWIRFTFPDDDYVLDSYPRCSSVEIEKKKVAGSFLCKSSGKKITLTGITETVVSGQLVSIRIRVTNPPISGVTGTFTIETGKENTNTLYDVKKNITGVTIQPGLLTLVSLQAFDSTVIKGRQKTMLYTLKFTTFNPVPQNGSIKIICNNNFSLDNAVIYRVISGLSDISETNELTLSYNLSLRTLTITGFTQVASDTQIELLLELTNPDAQGETMPVVIQTFGTDGVSKIDINETDAFESSITNYTAPTYTVVASSLIADGNPISLTVTLYPNIEIPQHGYIYIKLPAGMSVNNTLTCTNTPKVTATTVSATCVQTATDTIRVQVTERFIINLDSVVVLTNSIVGPSLAGHYVLDVITKDQNDSLVLETTSFALNFTERSLATYTYSGFHLRRGELNRLELNFQTNQIIPSGKIPDDLIGTHSWIELEFQTYDGTNNLYKTDLGKSFTTGSSVPCAVKTGISPESGETNISCSAISVPSARGINSPVIIKVKNYAQIAANTSFSIYIVGIENGESAQPSNITAKIKQKSNHVTTTLTSGTASLTFYNVANSSSNASTSAFSENEIQMTTDLTISGYVFPAQTQKIMFYLINPTSNGFCGTSCSIQFNYSQTASCSCYSDASLIFVESSITSIASTPIVLQGLQIPSSVPTLTPGISMWLVEDMGTAGDVTDDRIRKVRVSFDELPKIQPGQISSVTPQVSNVDKGAPQVTYFFSFYGAHTIPANGNIIVEFPPEYDLLKISPQPTCEVLSLEAATSSVSCTVRGNSLLITGFAEVLAGRSIEISVTGVTNPDAQVSAFHYYTFDGSFGLIDKQIDGEAITLNQLYQPGPVNYQYCTSFPGNAKVNAELEIVFSLSHSLMQGGKIFVILPSDNFGSIGSQAQCRISGAVNSYESCMLSGRTAIITLNKPIEYHKPIHVNINNILNPVAGLTSPVIIRTYYDDIIVDQTNLEEVDDRMSFLILETSEFLEVQSMILYPENEGQIATYVFNVKPNFSVGSDDRFTVIFPDEYGITLGPNLGCWAEGVAGNLSCQIEHARVFDIRDFQEFVPCSVCTIRFYISGIVNPNYNGGARSGSFQAGFRRTNNFSQFNDNIGTVTFQTAPGLIDIISMEVANNNSRQDNRFMITFETNNEIPSNDFSGEIWVLFPDDYVIYEATPYCLSSSYWASGVPTCRIEGSTVRLSGQSEQYTGQLSVTVDYIPNPNFEVTADTILVKSYSGLNNRVIDSSYQNLAPINFKYEYPGPLIRVNRDAAISVVTGTVSDYIPVELSYPVALNVTITPESDAFTFIPYSIDFTVGDLVKYFRISVPSGTADDTFYTTWTIYGDQDDPYYTPILVTQINVVNDIKEAVTVGKIGTIPIGGKSLPISVELAKGPDSDVQIQIELIYEGQGISLSSSTLDYSAGETVKYFQINVAQAADIDSDIDPYLRFSLAGNNRFAYKFAEQDISFQITYFSIESTYIVSAVGKNTRKYDVDIEITVNKPCTLYYARQLTGSDPISLSDAKAQTTPAYTTTQTYYGVHYLYTNTGTLTFDNLYPEMKYTFYFWVEDLLGRSYEEPVVVNIETDDRYAAAYTTLDFTVSFLSGDDEEEVRSALELILSLPNWRLLDRALSNTSRRLQQSYTQLSYYVIDDLNPNDYPRPVDILKRLEENRTKLSSLLPNWDANQDVIVNEEYIDSCFFDYGPEINIDSQYNEIEIVASLKKPGYVYASIELAADSTDKPTSTQVARGLNSRNVPVQAGFTFVGDETKVHITFTELPELTEYNVYMTCGNDYPGRPQLKTDDEVVGANWTTRQRPQPLPLDLDYGEGLVWSVFVMAVLLVQ